AVILPYRSGGFRSVRAEEVPTVGSTEPRGAPPPTRAPSVPPPVNQTRLAPDAIREREMQDDTAIREHQDRAASPLPSQLEVTAPAAPQWGARAYTDVSSSGRPPHAAANPEATAARPAPADADATAPVNLGSGDA